MNLAGRSVSPGGEVSVTNVNPFTYTSHQIDSMIRVAYMTNDNLFHDVWELKMGAAQQIIKDYVHSTLSYLDFLMTSHRS